MENNMSEPINSINRPSQADRPNSNVNGPSKSNNSTVNNEKIPSRDEFILSEVAKKALDNEPAFDRKKIESIRNAIQEGNYPLNTRRIAESFIAMESMIGNKKSDL